MTSAQVEDVLALSPLQEGLLALHGLAEDSSTGVDPYSMQFLIDIDGPVNVELLRRSAAAMLIRHPNLRAAFWDRDVPRPVQIIPSQTRLPWSERVATPAEFESIARSERRRPFDLNRGPALRIVLITVPGRTRRRMVFTAHHILLDGWSLAVFCTEMLAVYRAGGSLDGLPAAPAYRDYIAWLAGQDRTAAVAAWRGYLGEVSEPLMLADRAAIAGDGLPGKTRLLLSAADTARLRGWAAGAGLTLNTAVLFGWAVLLSRITDRRDVVFGTVVSGRPEKLPGVQGMVGLFINTVPVVHRLDRAESVSEQCRRLQRELAAMRDIGYLSLSELQREHGGGTLFDTLFVFENAPIETAIQPVTEPDGVRFTPVEMESLTHYPLTVVSHLLGDALVVLVEAVDAVLTHLPTDICGRLVEVLRQLPDCADRTPNALNILTPTEHARHRDPVVGPAAPAGATVWETFEAQARATPDATALTATDGTGYTYADLHTVAARLAHQLVDRGVGPEAVVALALPRSPRTIIGILAVLAAGAAYLPVDVSLPPARIRTMMRRAEPALALTEPTCARLLEPGLPALTLDDTAVAGYLSERRAVAPAVARHPDHPAYVIFTSGSTGEPKGVIGTNAALLAYFADHRDRIYRADPARSGRPLRIAHGWSFSFDASWQPMAGLLDGHCLHLLDDDEMRDADRLSQAVRAHRVDMIDTTPSLFVQLRAAGLLDRPLAVLALGGEAIDAVLWEQLRALTAAGATRVYNCYGPTETTVEAVVASVGEYPTPAIGTPNAGTVGYVLDSNLRPVPDGMAGELYLSGAQLARGYAGAPALTAARFVADPLRRGERMYRTGDLVRRLPGGGYAYLGRVDTQVKVRGYRVEISEVEAALRGLTGVADAAVSVLRRSAGPVLVGFVVWRAEAAADSDPAGLRAGLAELLPPYMIPARIVPLSRLPVNGNGKLDGVALGRLAEDALNGTAGGTLSAATDTERVLCEVFAEQLNGTVPHIDDDFFALGLDSVVAIAVVRAARQRELNLSPRMLFTAPTIRQLAAAISGSEANPGRDSVAPDDRYGEMPLLPMASWLVEYGNFRRFTHSVLLRLPAGIDLHSIEEMLQLLLDGHPVLRSTLVETPDGPRLVTRPPGAVAATGLLTRVTVPATAEAEFISAIHRSARHANDAMDPHRGAMLRAVWLCGTENRQLLLLTAHHLVVDVVSWHIMLGDLAAAWKAPGAAPEAPKALPELTPYRRWSQLMGERAKTPQVAAQLGHWTGQVTGPDPALGSRHPDPGRDTWSTLRATTVSTPVATTGRVLGGLTGEVGMREFLLAVTTVAVAGWRRHRAQDPAGGTLIALEGHGREDQLLDTDTTNTVGWFTTAYPVRLGSARPVVDVERAESDPAAARAALDSVVADLAAIPCAGLDYGLLRYLRRAPALRDAAEPQIQFGYLGRLDLGAVTDGPWSLLTGRYLDALPIDPEPDLPLRFALNISALVGNTGQGAQLITNLRWSNAVFAAADIDRLAELWQRSVAALADGLGGGPK